MEGAEAATARYWCYQCSRAVNPIMEIEAIKCPVCQNGFVEEMGSDDSETARNEFGGSDSDRGLNLWAPILLGLMNSPNPRRSHGLRVFEFGGDDDEEESNSNNNESNGGDNSERDHRRRNAAAILQILHGARGGTRSESNGYDGDEDTDRARERGRNMILINPFNETIVIQGSFGSNGGNPSSQNIGSLGDYFLGPSLDALLQHLAENDPNRYGTPPAQKEAVEAMPTVKIDEVIQCSVCLDDFEIGDEAKEMPCKHRFHSKCILPWLELHSSCPVCRYQLPADESKLDSNVSRRNSGAESNRTEATESGRSEGGNGDGGEARNNNGSGWFSVPLLWPFSSLFSSNNAQDVPPSSNSSTDSAPQNSHSHED